MSLPPSSKGSATESTMQLNTELRKVIKRFVFSLPIHTSAGSAAYLNICLALINKC